VGLLTTLRDTFHRLKAWAYSGFGRDRWQEPDRIVATLGLRPGDRVADIGAGGGYFTYRLATAVGSEGVVFAVDTDPAMLRIVSDGAVEDGFANIVTIQATEGLPDLPEAVDLAFFSNSYHHLPDHEWYFAALAALLRPGGRVAILESRGDGLFARIFGHATRPDVIQSEMAAAGYRLRAEHGFLRRQGFLIFGR
jgi:arsenite methyltransferase